VTAGHIAVVTKHPEFVARESAVFQPQIEAPSLTSRQAVASTTSIDVMNGEELARCLTAAFATVAVRHEHLLSQHFIARPIVRLALLACSRVPAFVRLDNAVPRGLVLPTLLPVLADAVFAPFRVSVRLAAVVREVADLLQDATLGAPLLRNPRLQRVTLVCEGSELIAEWLVRKVARLATPLAPQTAAV
jgi:hypothetical protein